MAGQKLFLPRLMSSYLTYYSVSAPVKFSESTLMAAPSLFMMHSTLPKNLGNSAPMKNCEDNTRPL
jgi:hypothetical protein